MPQFRYVCHGICFLSTFECPELRAADAAVAPDVWVREGETPEELDEPTRVAARFAIAPGQLLLRVDGVARFWVREGREIVVQASPEACMDDVRVFLYGTAFGAVLLQQGKVPLHATTVVKDGRALAFAGPSGVGKSTLAYTLLSRGWRLVCDDVTVLSAREGGLYAEPGFPSVKLWSDVLVARGADLAPLQRIRVQVDKYRWEAGELFCPEPARLAGVVGLWANDEPGVEVVSLRGVEKFRFLARQTFRRQMIKGMAEGESIFGIWGEAMSAVPIWRIRRARRPMDPTALADAVEALLS